MINEPTPFPPMLAPLNLGVVGRRKEARKRQRACKEKETGLVFSAKQVNSGNVDIG